MKLKPEKKHLQWGITAFLVIAAAILFYYVIFHMGSLKSGLDILLDILMPLIFGAVIAYLFWPLVKLFEQKLFTPLFRKMNVHFQKRGKKVLRLVSILLTLFLIVLGIYLLLAMLIPQVVNSIMNIVDNFPRYANNLQDWLSELLKDHPDMQTTVNDLLDNVSGRAEDWMTHDLVPQLNNLLKNLSSGLIGLVTFLKNLILGLIVSIYILLSKESLAANVKKGIYALFKTRRANQIIKEIRYINATFGGYIIGMLLDSLNIAILCYIGTTLLGMPYSILISVIVGVTNVIPFFGPYLGAIPSAILIFMVNPIQALYFIIFIFILQQIDGNFIAPRIIGDSTGISPLMVLAAIMIGGGMFGIPGMLFGVPVFAILSTITRNFIGHCLRKKKLPTEPEAYGSLDHVDLQTNERVYSASRKNIRPDEVFCFGDEPENADKTGEEENREEEKYDGRKQEEETQEQEEAAGSPTREEKTEEEETEEKETKEKETER
jgi:predicted PurR-regulated permease PerM